MRKPGKSRLTGFLVTVSGLALLTVMLAAVYGWHWLQQELPIIAARDGERLFEIEKGDSIGRVLKRFDTHYGLGHRHLLKVYARFSGLTHIKQGEYLLPARVTPIQLLEIFNQGRVRQHSLTLVEGITAREALTILGSQSLLKKTLNGLSSVRIATRLGIEQGQLEGWLFPDTYNFIKGSSDWALLQRAHQRMKDILAEEWQSRAEGLPYASPYEALIMASIIEKETGAPHERGQIAGVFVRRLQKGMRLQTDPTVIYGLGDGYDGNITRRHLKQATPYNTYVIKGLPPTPIALPGREAIHAALQPQPGESLYFVARGDGTHIFSVTLAEHRRAVSQYQHNRVDDYRSSLK